ncbi:MAG: T9SS type A sorting domain-containing protein [Psychroflexus sp.]
MKYLLSTLLFITFINTIESQSVAKEWNEEVLNAIRNDFARPTVHARNLFHTSVAMYDIWASFNSQSETYFLGNTLNGYTCTFNGFTSNETNSEAIEKAISFAVYRLINHRFEFSPGYLTDIKPSIENLMSSYGYDINYTNTDYSSGDSRALGNYIAQEIINYGLQDGSNEVNDYENEFYSPVNQPLDIEVPGNPTLTNPNRWQPLTLETFVDQSGNTIATNTPEFLSAEWGQVDGFALKNEDLTIYPTDDFDFWVYHDPGQPYSIQDGQGLSDPYKWNFTLTNAWSSHLDAINTPFIDISPASIGNLQSYPVTFAEYQNFYDWQNGGDSSPGHTLNPANGQPYQPQMIPLGDYARVLAEFWADGPDSETPPGHWFSILNELNENPQLVKKFEGNGNILSDLEWDVKIYLALGGALHDAAISAWGVKGYYDYIRPISAIRYMADQGQSSDTSLPNYDPHGIPLVNNFIETVQAGDPLVGPNDENLGKIKLKAWRGHDILEDDNIDVAGVDWILAENWFPYQKITFVTPNFAGYVSGHSTFSSAAAKVLESFTGDPFFPGGMGTFDYQANQSLEFEEGPSVDVQLQWATYKDAADQCSLSRIWGGIHPPIDDIPGRIMGQEIGSDAFDLSKSYFEGNLSTNIAFLKDLKIYPNPASDIVYLKTDEGFENGTAEIFTVTGRLVSSIKLSNMKLNELNIENLANGIYMIKLMNNTNGQQITEKLIVNK